MKAIMSLVLVSGVAFLAAVRPAAATIIVLNPPTGAADGVLQDAGPNGTFDSVVTTGTSMTAGGAGFTQPRQAAVVEFSVTGIPPGVHIISAQLYR
jgi:hypothetical protein